MITGSAAIALFGGLSFAAPALCADAAATSAAQAVAGSTAAPQDTAPPPGPAPEDATPAATPAGQVQEVVVTAERRTENLQRVPIAATVLNATMLEQRGVERVTDLQRVAPSVAINTYNRSTFINIRGVGIAQSSPTSTPGVAYYINGALVPHEFVIGTSFYDLDSIQVLRGPQGTLTGQNSTGGALYVTTPKPVIGRVSGYLDQTFGNYDEARSVGAINVPLGDYAAARISGVVESRNSFTKNIGGGTEPGNVNFWGGRADLLIKPMDRLTENLRYEFFHTLTGNNPIKNRADKVTSDPFTIEEDARSRFDLKGYRLESELKYELTSSIRLRYDLNYQYATIADYVDGDRTATATIGPPQNGRIGFTGTNINTLINEFDVISSSSGPFQWVVGAFDLRDGLPVALLTYGRDRVIPLNPPTRTTLLNVRNTSDSIFAQVSYRFSDQWQLTAGARESRDKQVFRRIVPAAPTGVALTTEPTGKVALNYNYTPNTLIYASVSRGYKAGGVNLGATDPPFAPERNTVAELGFKTTFADRHVRLNGAVYDSNYENLQLSSLTAPPPLGTPTIHNVPSSKIYGGELELETVFGATRFNGGVAYLHARSDSPAGLTNNTGIGPSFAVVASGTGLPFSPAWSANAGVEHDFTLGAGELTPRLQVSYIDSQWASIFHNANTFVPSHTLLDARLTYTPAGAMWRVEGYVTNLTNRTYIASQVQDQSSASGGIIYGAPRQYGLRMILKFD